tara:strand:- start:11122 stop:12870 length:1749 start_codon:yes stop_codon:yes gene_type:complete
MNSKFIKPNQTELVITITGQKVLKNECRYLGKKYYKIGNAIVEDSGDVYHILNQKTKRKSWFRAGTGYLVYDHRKKMYMLKTDLQVIIENGIVGFCDAGRPIFGTFSQDLENPSITQVSFQNKIYICLNEELVKNCKNFEEAISNGIYYERNSVPALNFTEPVSCSKEYKFGLTYDSKGLTKPWSLRHDKLYKPIIFPQVEQFHHVLKDLSFGLEFETTKGKIPDDKCHRLGLIPLRDGSIEGLEYVTIPLQGKLGIQTVIDSVEQLKKRTRFDNNCALHIHIGNLPRTEEFFIALYKVLFRIQEEIYDMFPFHKYKNLGIKKKHYTKPLPLATMLKLDTKISSKNVKENFDHIFRFLSMGSSYADSGNHLDNVTAHPSDPAGTSKWNIKTRYHWVNLIPLLFGNKQTVEFRIHTPTHDTNKVINYLFLCATIINFTKENTSKIIKNSALIANLTVHDILLNTIGKEDVQITKELSRYIDSRKEFISRRTRDGDLVANEDEFSYRSRGIDWEKPISADVLKKDLSISKLRRAKSPSFENDLPPLNTGHWLGNAVVQTTAVTEEVVPNVEGFGVNGLDPTDDG